MQKKAEKTAVGATLKNTVTTSDNLELNLSSPSSVDPPMSNDIKPNAKELARSGGGDVVVVVRPASEGGYNVGIVNPAGKPFWNIHHVDTKLQVARCIADDLRMANKCGLFSDMAAASRKRNF